MKWTSCIRLTQVIGVSEKSTCIVRLAQGNNTSIKYGFAVLRNALNNKKTSKLLTEIQKGSLVRQEGHVINTMN